VQDFDLNTIIIPEYFLTEELLWGTVISWRTALLHADSFFVSQSVTSAGIA